MTAPGKLNPDALPDLFEALDSMLVHFERKAGSKFQHDAVRKARSAIAKARGEQ